LYKNNICVSLPCVLHSLPISQTLISS
jgi:hypothetical protein